MQVIAPLSTLPHWKREFDTWTRCNTVLYHDTAGRVRWPRPWVDAGVMCEREPCRCGVLHHSPDVKTLALWFAGDCWSAGARGNPKIRVVLLGQGFFRGEYH